MSLIGGKLGEKINSTMSNFKINKEIADLEGKKATLVRAVMNEINDLNTDIVQLYAKFGKYVYDCHVSGKDITSEKLTEGFGKVTQLKKFVSEREAKIKDITDKYDEELAMLRSLVVQPDAQPGSGTMFCAACGGPNMVGDSFCGKCGNKI